MLYVVRVFVVLCQLDEPRANGKTAVVAVHPRIQIRIRIRIFDGDTRSEEARRVECSGGMERKATGARTTNFMRLNGLGVRCTGETNREKCDRRAIESEMRREKKACSGVRTDSSIFNVVLDKIEKF